MFKLRIFIGNIYRKFEVCKNTHIAYGIIICMKIYRVFYENGTDYNCETVEDFSGLI